MNAVAEVEQLLADLDDVGIDIALKDADRLSIDGPAEMLSDDLVDALKVHKEEIVAYLTAKSASETVATEKQIRKAPVITWSAEQRRAWEKLQPYLTDGSDERAIFPSERDVVVPHIMKLAATVGVEVNIEAVTLTKLSPSLSTMPDKAKPTTPCPCCRLTAWNLRQDGDGYVCGICHPLPYSEALRNDNGSTETSARRN